MKKICVLFAMCLMVFFISGQILAQTDEISGFLEVTPADPENNETKPSMIVDAGENAYRIISDDESVMESLIAADGKTVLLKGTIVASGEEYVMDNFKVISWQELSEPVEENLDDMPVDDEDIIMDGE